MSQSSYQWGTQEIYQQIKIEKKKNVYKERFSQKVVPKTVSMGYTGKL